MAEKKSGLRRIIDVQHPGKSVPDDTSKPVIVTNRPILKDPMMLDETDSSEDKKTEAVKISVKPIIKPLSAPELDKAEGDKPEEKPVEDAKHKLDPTKTISQLAEEAEAKQKKDEDAKPEPEEPKAEEPETKEAEAEKSDEDKDQKETSTDEDSESEDDEEKDNVKDEATQARDDQVKEAKEAKEQEDLQKLVDSKKYYLPINTVENRRSKRAVALGIFLSLFLAVAWADIALDAGLIHIHGIKSVTHFFSN